MSSHVMTDLERYQSLLTAIAQIDPLYAPRVQSNCDAARRMHPLVLRYFINVAEDVLALARRRAQRKKEKKMTHYWFWLTITEYIEIAKQCGELPQQTDDQWWKQR